MARLPDRVLKRRAQEARGVVDHALIRDLVDTMRASPACVGLAAPQIGVSRRVVVVDVTGHPKTSVCHGEIVLIDPVILHAAGHGVGREGCMSVPDFTANVGRSKKLVVGAVAPDRSRVCIETEGFEARALQHEIDHLDGTLILDRVECLASDVFARRTYK